MRMFSVVLVFSLFLAISFDTSECQLNFGPNGMRLLPPINLVAVFRFLMRTWKAFTQPEHPKSKIKESREVSEIQNRIKSIIDHSIKKENIDELLEEEKLILNDLKIRVNITCSETGIECKNMTLLNFIEKINETLTEEEREAASKLTDSSSLDFPVTELLDVTLSSEEENQKNTTQNSSNLLLQPKIPSFLPQPFSTGGWIISYIILNGVLLGLYVLIAWPYFLTGRTVDRVVRPIDTEGLNKTAQQLSEAEPYLGYTTYGDSDKLMSYLMSNRDDEDVDDDEEEASDYSGASGSGNGGARNNDDSVKGSGETSRSGEDNVEGRSSGSGVKEGSEYDQGKEDEGKLDEDTRCIENIMCLRPDFGARALSSASLALKILEWIPGLESIGSRFKRNVNRFGKAVSRGKLQDCHNYFCPKHKKKR